MFVLHPDPYLQPSYRISPFRTADITSNNTLPDYNNIDEYFEERFSGKQYQYTMNGREAIYMALGYYRLQKDDIVTILTTTGNFYISGCVTKEIEKFCKWSRQIESNTKVILVNHEFGFPYTALCELAKTGIPIIEDCAHSFFSKDENGNTGTIGDFIIYSFPKMFPLQIGGILISDFLKRIEKRNQIDDLVLKYIKKVLSHNIKFEEEIIKKRIFNCNYLKDKFKSLGFTERFKLDQGTVPGVFMFRTDKQKIRLPELKKYFYAHGVQCSIFYGENSFFIPVHQALNEPDLDYFTEVMKSFINQIAL
jgi:hypothetical protein